MDLPEIIGGKYRPRSVLGFGATGTVYCVEHTFTGDVLALKVLQPHLSASPEAITRFKNEARTAAKLRSRHVVRIFDADVARELGGAPYLVMELLEGSNLEQVSAGQGLSPDIVVKWFRQAAVPLERAHRLGIVHRDLKPENLFLTKSEDGGSILKILDFGIARIAESPAMTKSGQLFGTPLYMAPEQARAVPEEVGPPVDIFALGVIAYRLLTGADYRIETGLAQMLHEMLHEPLQSPSQKGHSLGEAFDAWFLRSCDRDPRRRFPAVMEQVEALAAAFGIAEEPTGIGPNSGPVSSGPESPRNAWTPPRSAVADPASLRATTIDRPRAGPVKLHGTVPGEDVAALGKPNGWRIGFFALAAVVLATGVAAWMRGGPRPARSASATVTAGCPVPSGGPSAVGHPVEETRLAASRAPPEPPAQTPPPPPSTKTTTTAMRSVSSDAARAAVARPTPPPALVPAAATSKRPTDDDLLSDQK